MKKIAFLHPDLGIGGAEQLVVNLCLAAKSQGYEPHIFTPRHHQSFPQTHDGTIIVHEHGSLWGIIPDTILGRFKGVLAFIRSILCVLWLLTHGIRQYDVVVADQVSIVLPFLRLFRVKTIFYCHYPDKLLAGKKSFIKKIYRFFLDLSEELSLLCANKIYVNSRYTQQVFNQNFNILRRKNVRTDILYPAIDLSKFDEDLKEDDEIYKIKKQLEDTRYFFSLNRYERKKNIGLALEAFAELIKVHPQISDAKSKLNLVVAGGYDLTVAQNIQHKQQLESLAVKLNIQHLVKFYTAISNEARKYLLRNAQCVLYTPHNQHFGIVPVQAMYSGVPVIADNSGGPQESIGIGCGYLCNSKQQWVQSMWNALKNKAQLCLGRKQVIEKFSFQYFTKSFVAGIKEVAHGKLQ